MNGRPESQNQQQSTSKNPSTLQQQIPSSPVKQGGNIFLCQEQIEGRKSPELFRDEPFPTAWSKNREYIVRF